MIPEKVNERLKEIKENSNPAYYRDKLLFCQKVYDECLTYEDVISRISRYHAFRVFQLEKKLLNKKELGEKYDAVKWLYKSAIETN